MADLGKERILILGDNPDSHTGFATNGAGVAWSLAKKYDVHYLGLQNFQRRELDIELHGEKRGIVVHENLPRDNSAQPHLFGERPDFGAKSLPRIMSVVNPDVLISINDIQMINHIPEALCPNTMQFNIANLPSRTVKSEYALEQQIKGKIKKWKERYPRDCRWLLLAPQDGEPPMEGWKQFYLAADKVIAMSKFGRYIFDRYYNMSVPHIYHGVDVDNLTPEPKRPQLEDLFVVGCNERNQPRKQPLRLMEAFAKFAKDKPDVKLWMQMDWNDKFGWPIRQFGRKFGILNKMIEPMDYPVPRDKLNIFKTSCDTHVNPTCGEGFGLCITEAFAAEKPMIATQYTTVEELIMDGSPAPRGQLVDYKDKIWMHPLIAAVPRAMIDIDDLTDKLNKYYRQRDRMKKHGENARKWVINNCSWMQLQNEWQEQVEDLLND